YKLQKSDIDSFFTASGKTDFSQRLIVSTTDNWSEHAEQALNNQQPPVIRITLHDLEASKIDWSQYQPQEPPVLLARKQLRPHQQDAVQAVLAGLKVAARGKLIMACGTGKTFTSLKIAEQLVGVGGIVAFMVPSLALLSQTLTEWTQESALPLHSFAVCSDAEVGKSKRTKQDAADELVTYVHELRYPATTEAKNLANAILQRRDLQHLTVIFSTYQSIVVLHQAQQKFGLPGLDLIICDEAHRTTGVTFADTAESNFVRVHNQEYVQANKRLYMTATPRIYGNLAKAKAEKDNIVLCSMDDVSLYGEVLHTLNFSNAVRLKLLVDYKVIVLAIGAKYVSATLQKLLTDQENMQLHVTDASKIVGCWKALAKFGLAASTEQGVPMQRAVAFCQVIEPTQPNKTHKVSSKHIRNIFQQVVTEYVNFEQDNGVPAEQLPTLECKVEHVDGSMGASKKQQHLDWLRAEVGSNECRI
ncbi:damage-inducible protein, partial [Achromatium sp. WMS2]